MTTINRVPIWVFASILLTALVSSYSLNKRYQAESLNKKVGLVADWDTVQTLAAGAGVSTEDAIVKLKGSGLTGIVVGETTLGEFLGNRSRLENLNEDMAMSAGKNNLSTRQYDRISNAIHLRYPAYGDGPLPPAELLMGVSIGPDPVASEQTRNAKLAIVARINNPQGVSEAYVRGMIALASNDGAKYFLPVGDQVLGRRDALSALDESLTKAGMSYCAPEFAKIGGDQNMIEMNPGNVIRLHSAQTQELDKLSQSAAVERYVKALSERNQRMLLVRPISFASANPVDSFASFIAEIKKGAHAEGYSLGDPHPFVDSGVPRLVFLLIALCMSPALFWLGCQFITGRNGQIIGAAALALLIAACLKDQGRQIASLVAATLFPLIAFQILDRIRENLKSIVLLFVIVSAISLTGGLAVAGLLNGLPFFVRADVFSGVKLAHFLPIGLIGAFFFWKLTPAKEIMKNPILWSQALLSIFMLVGFAFMASRTGNDSPTGVSGPELAFRSLLEQFLIVRPRTKELLLGHPAMILAIGMLIRSQTVEKLRGWAVLALMLGAIGQTSVVNTMCHLHTPLTVSLTRIGVGLVLGGIIGLMVWGAVNRFSALREK